jgi:hypothetical protein
MIMSPQQTGTIRILTAVNRPPGGGLDALAKSLPGLTWNQVILEVDPLSRRSQIHVTAGGQRDVGDSAA